MLDANNYEKTYYLISSTKFYTWLLLHKTSIILSVTSETFLNQLWNLTFCFYFLAAFLIRKVDSFFFIYMWILIISHFLKKKTSANHNDATPNGPCDTFLYIYLLLAPLCPFSSFLPLLFCALTARFTNVTFFRNAGGAKVS